MTGTATAWERLAVRLYTAAADYRAVISKLPAVWEGPTATAMAEAAAPYIDWLHATAAQADQAAIRTAAAARAYQSALASMAAPSVIEANRKLRNSLAAANCLGQASAAIAETEAEHERMWAQDVATMHAYAGAAAEASRMTPFRSPPVHAEGAAQGASGTWALRSAPELVATGSQVVSAIPDALETLSLSPLATFDVPLQPLTSPLSKLSSLSAPSDFAILRLNMLNKAAALRWLSPNQGGARPPAIVARLGRGRSIRSLSVPRSWRAAAKPIPVRRGTVA